MKKFTETLGQKIQRIREQGPFKPLRTITELADELGVTRQWLALNMAHGDGPKPSLRHAGSRAEATWYDPDEVRAWWRRFQSQGDAGAPRNQSQ
jgi:hypothetical protein